MQFELKAATPYAISHSNECVGKMIPESKRRLKWKFSFGIDGPEYCVTLTHSLATGKKRIVQDKQEVCSIQTLDAEFSHSWQFECHKLQIYFSRSLEPKYQFMVDGILYEQLLPRGIRTGVSRSSTLSWPSAAPASLVAPQPPLPPPPTLPVADQTLSSISFQHISSYSHSQSPTWQFQSSQLGGTPQPQVVPFTPPSTTLLHHRTGEFGAAATAILPSRRSLDPDSRNSVDFNASVQRSNSLNTLKPSLSTQSQPSTASLSTLPNQGRDKIHTPICRGESDTTNSTSGSDESPFMMARFGPRSSLDMSAYEPQLIDTDRTAVVGCKVMSASRI